MKRYDWSNTGMVEMHDFDSKPGYVTYGAYLAALTTPAPSVGAVYGYGIVDKDGNGATNEFMTKELADDYVQHMPKSGAPYTVVELRFYRQQEE